MNRSKLIYPVLLLLLWIILVIIVNPVGNFPLNDDWQYARPVWYLINKGYYFSPDEFSPIIVAQVFWGALWCLPGGFSFTTLRISMLVLGLSGVIAFYFLLKRITKNDLLSFLGAVILLINPFYFFHAFSFMTDTSFMAIAIISIYYFYRHFESGQRKFLFWGTLFAVISTLIRQFCIVIPFAYGVAAILRDKPKIKHWFSYFIPAIITTFLLKSTLFWLKYIGSELKPYGGMHLSDFLSQPRTLIVQLFERVGYILYYPGFFLFPFLVFRAVKFYKILPVKDRLYTFAFSLLFIPSLIFDWAKMPCGYVINIWSLGPKPIRIENIPDVPDNPYVVNSLIAIAFIGALLLLFCIGSILVKSIKLYRKGALDKSSELACFIIASMAGYSLLMFIPGAFFDRYLLFYIPLFFVLIAIGWEDFKIAKSAVAALYSIILLPVLIFSVFGTHDYLDWNRARWQALNYLTEDLKISPHKIDGGYEFNGWTIGKFYPWDRGKSWWYVDDDEYMVMFGSHKGYSLIKQYPYTNYIRQETRYISIEHRK